MKKIKTLLIALILAIMSMLTFVACDISLVPDDPEELIREYLKNINVEDLLSEEDINRILDNYLRDKDLREFIDLEELLQNENLWDYVDAETLIRDPRFKEVFNELLEDEDEETREVLRGIFREFLAEENLWQYLLKDEKQFKQVLLELLQGENGAEILQDWLSDPIVRQRLFDLFKDDPNFKQMLLDLLKDDPDFKQMIFELLKSEDGAEILKYWLAEDNEDFRKLLEEILAEMLFDENGLLVGLEELFKSEDFKDLLEEILKEMLFDENGQLVGLNELLNSDDFKNLLKEVLTEMLEEGDLDLAELLEDEAFKQILTEIVEDILANGDISELIGQEQMKGIFLTLLEEDAEFKQAVLDALRDDIKKIIDEEYINDADINQLLTDPDFINAALANETIRETIINGIVANDDFFMQVLFAYANRNN